MGEEERVWFCISLIRSRNQRLSRNEISTHKSEKKTIARDLCTQISAHWLFHGLVLANFRSDLGSMSFIFYSSIEGVKMSKGTKRSYQPSNGCNLDIRSRQNDIQKAEENEDNENIKCYEAEPSLEFVEDVSHHVTRNLTIDDGECASVSNGAHEKAISSDLQTSISSEDDTQILTASSDQTEIPFERNQC
ncbi:hypothetical protein AAC387_Pa01g3058 [Persea americana]